MLHTSDPSWGMPPAELQPGLTTLKGSHPQNCITPAPAGLSCHSRRFLVTKVPSERASLLVALGDRVDLQLSQRKKAPKHPHREMVKTVTVFGLETASRNTGEAVPASCKSPNDFNNHRPGLLDLCFFLPALPLPFHDQNIEKNQTTQNHQQAQAPPKSKK